MVTGRVLARGVWLAAVAAACASEPGDPGGAVFGAWRVTGSACPARCAISPGEAASWRGRAAGYSESVAHFADNTCDRPRYEVAYWPAGDAVYGGARLGDLGIRGDSAMVVEVRCPPLERAGSDPRWDVPGGFLIVKDHEHMLMVWEGVYFELTREQARR